jgi:hypothetical protein
VKFENLEGFLIEAPILTSVRALKTESLVCKISLDYIMQIKTPIKQVHSI